MHTIEKCGKFCTQCSDQSTCTKCEDGQHLLLNVCHPDCAANSYATLDGRCEKCAAPCDKCSNSTSCITCMSNKYFFEAKCLDECPHGYFSTKDFTCSQCHYSCGTCSGKLNDKTYTVNHRCSDTRYSNYLTQKSCHRLI